MLGDGIRSFDGNCARKRNSTRRRRFLDVVPQRAGTFAPDFPSRAAATVPLGFAGSGAFAFFSLWPLLGTGNGQWARSLNLTTPFRALLRRGIKKHPDATRRARGTPEILCCVLVAVLSCVLLTACYAQLRCLLTSLVISNIDPDRVHRTPP